MKRRAMRTAEAFQADPSRRKVAGRPKALPNLDDMASGPSVVLRGVPPHSETGRAPLRPYSIDRLHLTDPFRTAACRPL